MPILDKLSAALQYDGLLVGPLRLVVRGFSRAFSSLNAKLHGFDGLLPLGSQVSGLKYITIHDDFRAHGKVWIEAIVEYAGRRYCPRIVIGRSFRASDRLHISAIGSISIGDNCLFGSSVFVGDHAHGAYKGHGACRPEDPPADRFLGNQGNIEIGDNCWVGDNVVIVGPVRIGRGSVVAANSVVTRDVDAGTLVAGAPARRVKKFDDISGQWLEYPSS